MATEAEGRHGRALTDSSSYVPPTMPLIAQGKVRDLYAIDSTSLLFVATDRISAYDAPLTNGIPAKGILLNQLSAYWMSLLHTAMPSLKTHLISTSVPEQVSASSGNALSGRCSIVRRLKVFPLEAIVRGYLTGSAWAEYQRSGTVHGIQLPAGLRESEALPGGALYTPSTKAPPGQKDENISPTRAREIVGDQHAAKIEELALGIYGFATQYAKDRGIIIADTKFEFGLDEATGEVVLVDETLTPDSSRFWDVSRYVVGHGQESYDKQFLRDWLVKNGQKGKADVLMPEEVVAETSRRYEAAFEAIVGKSSSIA
jgi:phosphoribosylaminoimidazole-succinocarboxamide synthase